MSKKRGSIVIQVSKDANFPLPHEWNTLHLLQKYAKTAIEFIAPARSQGVRTPDIKMDNLHWEIKSPKGTGKYTMEHCIKAASKQCENVILDIRRMQGSYRHHLPKIQREFKGNYRLKRMKIITKAQKIIDLNK